MPSRWPEGLPRRLLRVVHQQAGRAQLGSLPGQPESLQIRHGRTARTGSRGLPQRRTASQGNAAPRCSVAGAGARHGRSPAAPRVSTPGPATRVAPDVTARLRGGPARPPAGTRWRESPPWTGRARPAPPAPQVCRRPLPRLPSWWDGRAPPGSCCLRRRATPRRSPSPASPPPPLPAAPGRGRRPAAPSARTPRPAAPP